MRQVKAAARLAATFFFANPHVLAGVMAVLVITPLMFKI